MVSSDKELEGQLIDAGKKLLRPPPSIDDLLPLLDHVENCLSKVEQSPRKSMQDALSTLQKALVANELIKHPEVDVKVAVASCISEITRISAPEAPYEDDVMKEVFQLIVSSFDNISDKSSWSFVKRVSILETVSKVRSCVVMLDLECDSLIVEMFRHFMREIRDYHDENVFSSMEMIMTLVIDESEDISTDLLCTVLDSVKKDEQAFPMAKKLGEKVLENCAKKLKPFLGLALKSLGVNSDDYSVVVASICASTNGVVEQSNVRAVTDERSVSPQDGPALGVSLHAMDSNGLTLKDESLAVSSSLTKEQDGCENLTPKESVDTNEGKQGGNDSAAKAELWPELDSVKIENELISSAEASNPLTNTVIAEEGSQKREDKPLESSPDQPASLLQKDSYEPGLPAESRVEASVELLSSKTPQNESADAAKSNQNDDVPNESKAHEQSPLKQECEVEEAKVPSNDLDEKKTVDKEDLAGEIDADKGGGVTTDSSSEEKTLTVEDVVKDKEAVSDSAATKSNKSKGKVSVKPEKKVMPERMQEKREITKLPNKRNDALKSSKNFDKKETVHPLKSPGKKKECSVETPQSSLKRKDTPSKEEGSGAKKDGAALVGSKIKVWWPMDKAFYKGRVADFDAVTKKHRILYIDGDVEVLFLKKERWEIIKDDFGDEDEAMEDESLDASLEMPPKKAKLMKPTHLATKQGKLVSTPKQGSVSSSGKLKVDATASTASHKSKDRREDDAGGESIFRAPKSSHKSVDTNSDKAVKSDDNNAGTSSKVTNPKGNVSDPKNRPIKSTHRTTPDSANKSKSKQDGSSKPMGKLPESLGKSSNEDDSGKVRYAQAKSKGKETTDEEEDSPGSQTVIIASNKKRKLSGSSSPKGKVGKSGSGKKR